MISQTITLCGSTRFKIAFMEWNAILTLQGYNVFSVAMWGHCMPVPPSPAEKIVLDKVHFNKIDNSPAGIFVLDVNKYIGESTRNEINHTLSTGKPVRYLSVEFPDWQESDAIYARDAYLQQQELLTLRAHLVRYGIDPKTGKFDDSSFVPVGDIARMLSVAPDDVVIPPHLLPADRPPVRVTYLRETELAAMREEIDGFSTKLAQQQERISELEEKEDDLIADLKDISRIIGCTHVDGLARHVRHTIDDLDNEIAEAHHRLVTSSDIAILNSLQAERDQLEQRVGALVDACAPLVRGIDAINSDRDGLVVVPVNDVRRIDRVVRSGGTHA